MMGYLTLGTCDLARDAKFYDAIAKEPEAGRIGESDRFIAWRAAGGGSAW